MIGTVLRGNKLEARAAGCLMAAAAAGFYYVMMRMGLWSTWHPFSDAAKGAFDGGYLIFNLWVFFSPIALAIAGTYIACFSPLSRTGYAATVLLVLGLLVSDLAVLSPSSPIRGGQLRLHGLALAYLVLRPPVRESGHSQPRR
jgi:hypothetical protein